MQDILIVYDSKTGNTEKVAKALAEAAGERCVLAQVDAAPAADDFAVVVAGYWVDKGAPNAKMKRMENGSNNRFIFSFFSFNSSFF